MSNKWRSVLLSGLLFFAGASVSRCVRLASAAEGAAAVSALPALPNKMVEIGDVTTEALDAPQRTFDALVNEGEKTVLFRLNSNGGSIVAGYEFTQHVEEAKKRTGVRVKCVVDYRAMSMGFALLQSICDERLMTKRSVLLAHNASVDLDRTNAAGLEEMVSMLRAYDKALSEMCAARLHISVNEYRKRIAHADWTMSWDEALAVGAVDGVIEPLRLPPLYVVDAAPKEDLQQLLRRLFRSRTERI